MNLQQTIDELEAQAAKYTQAAAALRELLNENVAPPLDVLAPVAAKRGRKPNAQKTPKAEAAKGKKRVVSDEVRARLSANMKARHEQRRAQKADAEGAE